MRKAAYTAAIYGLALMGIPWWIATEVLAGRWDARKVDLRRAWEAIAWPRGRP